MDITNKAYVILLLQKKKQSLWREKKRLEVKQHHKYRLKEIDNEILMIVNITNEIKNEI